MESSEGHIVAIVTVKSKTPIYVNKQALYQMEIAETQTVSLANYLNL